MGKQIVKAIKIAIAAMVVSPFLIILLPMWFIYRWSEVAAGRPAPEPPWAVLRGEKPFHERQGRPSTGSGMTTEAGHVDPSADSLRRGSGFVSVNGDVAVERDRLRDGGSPPSPGGTPPQPPQNEAGIGWGDPALAAWRGQTALVTGGGRRLGAAICRELAGLGMKVAIACHRSCVAAEGVAREIVEASGEAGVRTGQGAGAEAVVFEADLSNPAALGSLLNAVERRLGTPMLLVNNAALFSPTDLEEASWEVMEAQFKINLQAPLWLSLRAARGMRAAGGGGIINIADIWGERPLSGHAAYSASKAGLIMATRALARDLAPRVRVNAIAPGALLAPDGDESADAFERMRVRAPLDPPESGPHELLRALRYLLAADYVTGEVIHIDGGRRLL